MAKSVHPSDGGRRYAFPTHINELIVDRADARTSEVFMVEIEPGKGPPVHRHPDTEQVFYVIEGEGVLSLGEPAEVSAIRPGDVVIIPPDTPHTVAAGAHRVRYLCVDCFVSDEREEPTWDEHVRAVCARMGWDYGAVAGGGV